MAGTAAGGFGSHERGQVTADQRLHHRMLRAERLQQHLARRFRPPGPARNLMQQLHRPLRCAQIAARQAQVGIHHPHQRQMRKMPTLGHDLRADDEVDLPPLDPVRGVGRGGRAGQGVAGHYQAARIGKQGVGFLGNALDAGADRHQAVLRPAGGARGWNVLRMRAMVARQHLPRPVLHKPRGAIRALHPVPARPAQRERRIAAAVQEQHGLLAPRDGGTDRVDQHWRQKPPARRRVHAHVDGGDRGQRRPAMARVQREPLVAPGLHIAQCFQAGRSGNQHGRGGAQPGTHDRHVARVVGHTVFLLERRLMLLIHNNKAEIRERQEQRGACAHDDRRRPLRHRAPREPPDPRRQVGVPDGGRGVKPPGATVQPLRAQGNFRQQHQRLPPLRHARGDGLQINLGLAGAGHAVQQRDAEPSADRGPQRCGGDGLFRAQRRAGAGHVGHFWPGAGQGHPLDQSGLHHGPHDGWADGGSEGERREGEDLAGCQRLQHAGASWGEPDLF